jgi:hypothetical protein
MFAVWEVLLFGVIAGLLAAAAVAAVPSGRQARRIISAGVSTMLGFIAWNLTLNATDARGFNVDAPVIPVSWADAGSGILAFAATAFVLGLVVDREEPARRIVGLAAVAGFAALFLDLFVL